MSLERFEARAGRLLLAMGRHGRYRGIILADIEALVVAPLLAGCVAFASTDGSSASPSRHAVAIWASASPEVGRKIAEQADGGIFPVRLDGSDWRSGDQAWLLDIVATDREAATAMFTRFSEELGREFRMHPVVLQSVDPVFAQRIRDAVSSATVYAGDGD